MRLWRAGTPAALKPGLIADAASPAVGTLEQLLEAKSRGPAALDRLGRRIQRESRFSTGFLGLGLPALGAAVMVRGVISFLWASPGDSRDWASAGGWMALGAMYLVVIVVGVLRRGVLPLGVFLTALGVGVLAMGLDLLSFLAPDGSGPLYPTVSVGVGATLLACVSFRPLADIVRALIVLTVLATATLFVLQFNAPENLAIGTSILLLSVTPVAAALALASLFDQNVRRLLDAAVVESTIDATESGPGILAVTALARLDSRAERLFDSVAESAPGATGSLPAGTAEDASRLGDELRAVLFADHEMTWLQLAVADSAYLSPVVTVSDPAGLAAQLTTRHRSALLSAIWLIADPSGAVAGAGKLSIDLALIPRAALSSNAGPSDAGLTGCTIAMTIAGITLRSIDPAVWTVLGLLGPREADVRASRILLRIEIVPEGTVAA